MLVEFTSVVDAVRCAITLQRRLAASIAIPAKRIVYRIGINVGDIVVDGDDILGDSVNIAARLQTLAEPGGIWLSAASYDHVYGKVDAEFADMGEQQLHNIARPVRAYRIVL